MKDLAPGTVVFVDSNMRPDQDCFAVIVDSDFWFKAVETEKVILPQLEDLEADARGPKMCPENYCLFRILGHRTFPQNWLTNSPEAEESFCASVVHNHFQIRSQVSPIDLRPHVALFGDTNDRMEGGKIFFHEMGAYLRGALKDAAVLYRYLDGERFSSPKWQHISVEEKLLRLLEKAIPR
jgi:hypothetical protein